jgi:hypothetical protein
MIAPPPVRGLSFGNKVAVHTPIFMPLSPLTLSANQFMTGDPQGTVIGIIQGISSGSTLLLTDSNFGAVQLADGVIQVGPAPPAGQGVFDIELMEMLSGSPNSPHTTHLKINEVQALPHINTPPSIPTIPVVGSPITAIDATWINTVTSLTYQWQAGGINATGLGATSLTYRPGSGDLGLTLTITVTAANSAGQSQPSISAPSSPVIAASSDVLKIALQITANSLPIAA